MLLLLLSNNIIQVVQSSLVVSCRMWQNMSQLSQTRLAVTSSWHLSLRCTLSLSQNATSYLAATWGLNPGKKNLVQAQRVNLSSDPRRCQLASCSWSRANSLLLVSTRPHRQLVSYTCQTIPIDGLPGIFYYYEIEWSENRFIISRVFDVWWR